MHRVEQGRRIVMQNTRTIDNMLFAMFVIFSVRPDLEEELTRDPHPSITCLLNVLLQET